jgi:uncharacterized membrane protein YccC
MDMLRPNCAYPSSSSLLEAAFVVSTLLDAEHPIPHNSLSSALSRFFPSSQSYKIHKARRKTEYKKIAIALRKIKTRKNNAAEEEEEEEEQRQEELQTSQALLHSENASEHHKDPPNKTHNASKQKNTFTSRQQQLHN